MEKNVDLTDHGISKMSKAEIFRHSIAKIVRVALIFGVPLILTSVIIFITGIIYIVRPYFRTKDFTRTTCQVTGYSVHTENTYGCSDGTDTFYPCVKINVMYGTSNATAYRESIIMENEQALVSCDQCSFTFGKHGLLHQLLDSCESWNDSYNPDTCINDFILTDGKRELTYPCYFNPNRPSEVVKDLVVDSNAVIHAISWPILLCLIYFLGFTFVCYDSKQVRCLCEYNESVIQINRKNQEKKYKLNRERTRSQLGKSLGIYHAELGPSSSHDAATPSQLRRSESIPGILGSSKLSDECGSTMGATDNGIISLDLRHLDLAVSERNIEDLTVVCSPIPEPLTISYENEFANNFPCKPVNTNKLLPSAGASYIKERIRHHSAHNCENHINKSSAYNRNAATYQFTSPVVIHKASDDIINDIDTYYCKSSPFKTNHVH